MYQQTTGRRASRNHQCAAVVGKQFGSWNGDIIPRSLLDLYNAELYIGGLQEGKKHKEQIISNSLFSCERK